MSGATNRNISKEFLEAIVTVFPGQKSFMRAQIKVGPCLEHFALGTVHRPRTTCLDLLTRCFDKVFGLRVTARSMFWFGMA
jgi:hypothetical protein